MNAVRQYIQGIVADLSIKTKFAMHYVYILHCKDNSTYTGCTEDLKERFQRHTNGHVPATEHLLPVELIFYCAFKDKYKAFEFEKYLKSGSGRAFMQKRILKLPNAIPCSSVKTTTNVK